MASEDFQMNKTAIYILLHIVLFSSATAAAKPDAQTVSKLLGAIKYPGIDISIRAGFSLDIFDGKKKPLVWNEVELKKSVASGQASPLVYRKYGDYLFHSGKMKEGLSMYQEAYKIYLKQLRISDKKAGIYLAIGDMFRAVKKYDKAASAYYRATNEDKDNAEAWLRLHQALLPLKKWKHALYAINQVVRLRPKDPEGFLHYQFFLFFHLIGAKSADVLRSIKQGTFRMRYGLKPIERAIALKPEVYKYRFHKHCMGMMFILYRNMYAHGSEVLKKLSVTTRERAFLLRSVLFFKDALDRRGVKRSTVISMQAWTHLLLGKIKEAEGIFRREVERNPADHASYDGLYVFAMQIRGDYAVFRKLAFEKIKGSPRIKDFLIAGKFHYKDGQLEKSLEKVKKGLQLDAADAVACLSASAVCVRMGKYADAQRYLDRIKENAGKYWVRSRYWSAILAISTGRRGAARRALTALMQADPSHKGGRKLMRDWFRIR